MGAMMSQWGDLVRGVYEDVKQSVRAVVREARKAERERRAQKSLTTATSFTRSASRKPVGPRRRSSRHTRAALQQLSKAELYQQARELGVKGRSKMDKETLRQAVERHGASLSKHRSTSAEKVEASTAATG